MCLIECNTTPIIGPKMDKKYFKPQKKANGTHKERRIARIELSLKQNHACAICGKVMRDKLILDHCHKSGNLRGLLCITCNTGLGMFNDNPVLLDNATRYLKGESCF